MNKLYKKKHTLRSVFFFVYWHFKIMKSLPFIGIALVIIGSFLPLAHIPFIGNWDYWNVHSGLAIICWILTILALPSVIFGKKRYTIIIGILLIILFSFTIYAIRHQSESFFSFLFFDKWIKGASSIVKIQWGWGVLYLGAALLAISGFLNNQTSTKNI